MNSSISTCTHSGTPTRPFLTHPLDTCLRWAAFIGLGIRAAIWRSKAEYILKVGGSPFLAAKTLSPGRPFGRAVARGARVYPWTGRMPKLSAEAATWSLASFARRASGMSAKAAATCRRVASLAVDVSRSASWPYNSPAAPRAAWARAIKFPR